MEADPALLERSREALRAQGWPVEKLTLLPGDVSPRRYARVALATGETAILALYPDDQRDVQRRFAQTTRLLEAADVRVPRILAGDDAGRWALVEDLGPETLFELGARWSTLERYYQDTVAIIGRLQRLPLDDVAPLSPPLDAALLRAELERTWTIFLAPAGLLGPDPEAFGQALDALCDRLTEEPLVPCHRDLMVRNLVPIDDRRVAVIDHQDLRLGPSTYDLASLLNDSLFAPDDVAARVLASALPEPRERLGYHRAAAQRTLKAVGTFAACAAGGSAKHAALLPPTLARATVHLASVPETADLAPALCDAWQPTIAAGTRDP